MVDSCLIFNPPRNSLRGARRSWNPTYYIPNGSTTETREQIIREEHKEDRYIFDNKTTMDDALKGEMVDTIEDAYLYDLRNRYTRYLGVTTRDLPDHLIDWYGKITAANHEANKIRMNDPIDKEHTND